MSKPKILVFGANPAWQKTLYFPRFQSGEVNRAEKMDSYASGKGVNFCRAARCRGVAEVELYQFSGGENGRRHENFLRAEGIACQAVQVAAETRCCITLLDLSGAGMTELIEPSQSPGEAELTAMLSALDVGLAQAQGLAITGSLPDGTDKSLYVKVARLAAKHGVKLLVDAIYAPMLDAAQNFLLKINLDELKKLTGEREALVALRAGMSRWSDGVLAITDGSSCAYLAEKGRIWRYSIPEIKVVSPLGSGDTCSAVMLSEMLSGKPAAEAFACALAAASANCLSPRAGEFSNAEAAKLLPKYEPLP